MAVLKATSTRTRGAEGGVFDLADLRTEAEGLLASARAEAARIVADARREADAIRRAAHDEGHAAGEAAGRAAGEKAGRAAGEAAGRAEARAAHAEELARIENGFGEALVAFASARDERMRECDRELAGVAIAIAEGVVRREVRSDRALVLREVEDALALFSRATRLRIEIDPEDEAVVREAMPSLSAALPADADIALVAVPGIGRGGCMIRSPEGAVDARIDVQFRRMRDGIVGEEGAA